MSQVYTAFTSVGLYLSYWLYVNTKYHLSIVDDRYSIYVVGHNKPHIPLQHIVFALTTVAVDFFFSQKKNTMTTYTFIPQYTNAKNSMQNEMIKRLAEKKMTKC